MIKSCYIHIPFCKNICSYCDFCKNYYNEKIVNKYLDSLKEEINNMYNSEILDTLYIGGGTPSSLSKKALSKLFKYVNLFKLNKDYEFTFECNYEDITEELLIFLKENKVNRLSIGIQTFNKKFENFLNRKINKDEMLSKINLCKKYFDNINIDLMYAIENQSIYDLKEDLGIIVDLDVKHVSTYALIIEEHTQLGINNFIEVKDDLQSEMYFEIADILNKYDFNHYEISNFAKKGYESKHNLTYWNNKEYYGFGAGASGFVNNVRYDNTKSILNYINGKTINYEELVDDNQRIRDEIMLLLRTKKGISINNFKSKYNINLCENKKIIEMIDNGYLIKNNYYLKIPEKYFFISNEIILKILEVM